VENAPLPSTAWYERSWKVELRLLRDVQTDQAIWRYIHHEACFSVLLVPREETAWRIAMHRFAEVCIGLAVAVILTMAWPEPQDNPSTRT
jgi:hypothetical protein